MGGALLVAIVVAMLVQAKVGTKPQGPGPLMQILVANKRLPTGTELKAEDTRWQDWPESALFTGVIEKKDYPDDKQPEVYGTPVRRPIESGEPITAQAMIDSKGASSFLAASISPGMRAVSIPVSLDTSVGGFIQPGDHVDIMLAYSVSVPSDAQQLAQQMVNRYASQTVLSNVKILAVDQAFKNDPDTASADGKTSIRNITVEVTKEGAETLALSKQMGDLSLSLRRIGEVDTPESMVTPITTDVSTVELLKRLNAAVTRMKSNSTVRVYTGTGIQNVPVRNIQESGK